MTWKPFTGATSSGQILEHYTVKDPSGQLLADVDPSAWVSAHAELPEGAAWKGLCTSVSEASVWFDEPTTLVYAEMKPFCFQGCGNVVLFEQPAVTYTSAQ